MKKALIIQTAFLGDVILSLALVEKLAEYYPEAKISFLCKKGTEVALQNNPHIHNVLLFDKSKRKIRNILRLIASVRKEKYDMIINAHRFFSSGAITVFGAAAHTAGFRKNPFSFLYNERFPYRIGKNKKGVWMHELERNQQLIARITDGAYCLPKLYPSKADAQIASSYIRNDRPHICVSPSSVWYTKRWPADKWAALIGKFPHRVVYLLGAAADKELCEKIKLAAEHPQVVNLAGLAIMPSAALMQAAAMNFANDSAPLHICTAMQAPVRGIFCSTTESFGFGPLGENAACIESKKNLICKPCGFHGHQRCPQGHFECASSIEVEQIMDTL